LVSLVTLGVLVLNGERITVYPLCYQVYQQLCIPLGVERFAAKIAACIITWW